MRASLKHTGPGGASGRVFVMGAKCIFQCADDHDFDSVEAFVKRFGYIAPPWLVVDVSGVFSVDSNFSYASIPFGEFNIVSA